MRLLGQPGHAFDEQFVLPGGLEDSANLFERLRRETFAELDDPQMQVGRVEGAFLKMMVQISGARRVLEIGTYSGYSGLSMASGLPDGGRLLTLDIDPVATAVAQRYFSASPWADKIELRLGPALETIRGLGPSENRFDLVFIDADKESYLEYWEAVLPLLLQGGIVLADNALWNGAVLDPRVPSDFALAAFNERVQSDPRVDNVLLSVRDGIMLCRKT